MIRTVYLAGPDVFLPNASKVGSDKAALCAQHGFDGLFPLDNSVPPAASPAERGTAIYHANIAMMDRADAILANLTPFRGPSADAGTVFELGYFAARGKPLYAYSSDRRLFAERTRQDLRLPRDAQVDGQGLFIEDFGLTDNLMLAGAVAAAGGVWISRQAALGEEIAAMEAFRACLATLAKAAAASASTPSVTVG